MKVDYQKIIDFMTVSGKRLVKRAGNIDDIGITKINLTEEDLTIERGFKDIIKSFDGEHVLYAEEENDFYESASNIWVADPISGTHNFIKGLPHYAIVISHLVDHKTVFAAVYDPSVDHLYTAYLGRGSFLNGEQIKVNNGLSKKMIARISSKRVGAEDLKKKIRENFAGYEIEDNKFSMAVNYCWVASGLFDGIISFTKDSFPEFAGSLIVREAGGNFTNKDGQSEILPSDRIFIGGNENVYKKILAFACNN